VSSFRFESKNKIIRKGFSFYLVLAGFVIFSDLTGNLRLEMLCPRCNDVIIIGVEFVL